MLRRRFINATRTNSAARIEELEEKLRECEAKVLSLTPLNTSTAAAKDAIPKSGSIEDLNEFIRAQFEREYDASRDEDGLNVGAQPDLFPCGKITLECLHADATNLDCFIHSFLIATCANFRAAKHAALANTKNQVAGMYKEFATHYRREMCVQIAETVYANPEFVPLGGKGTRYTLADLKSELLGESVPLPDDLVKCLCFYYNINVIIIGPGSSQGRMTRLIQGRATLENDKQNRYTEAYAISNKYGGHFEPCRIQGENRYLLTAGETQCIVKTYNGSRRNPMNVAGAVKPDTEWACPDCTFVNKESATECGACGKKKPVALAKPAENAKPLQIWACPDCTTENPDSAKKCEMCEKQNPDPRPLYTDFTDKTQYVPALIQWLRRHPEHIPGLKKKGGTRKRRSVKRKTKHYKK